MSCVPTSNLVPSVPAVPANPVPALLARPTGTVDPACWEILAVLADSPLSCENCRILGESGIPARGRQHCNYNQILSILGMRVRESGIVPARSP
jgi:hypothetical protein